MYKFNSVPIVFYLLYCLLLTGREGALAAPEAPAPEDAAAVEIIDNILNEAEDAEMGQVT